MCALIESLQPDANVYSRLLMNEEAHQFIVSLLNSLRMSSRNAIDVENADSARQLPEKCSGVAFKAGGDCSFACLGMKLTFSYHPVFPFTPHVCILRISVSASVELSL